MVLETPAAFDAAPGVPGDKAILVYAGLGQTAASVEPADWMSRVLRGCSMPLEPSLHLLTDAVRQHLPQHLQRLDPNGKGIAHSIFVPAIVRDESQLYSIEYVITPAGQGFWRHVRHVIERAELRRPRTPRIAIGGSGAVYLARQPRRWIRPLLRLVKACDAGQIPTLSVADHLAWLNNEVHKHDRLVGARCIVAWRNRRHSVHNGGGGHQFYTGEIRDQESPALPSIVYGRDMRAFLGVIAPPAFARLRAMGEGRPDPGEDYAVIEKAVNALPNSPDEKLT